MQLFLKCKGALWNFGVVQEARPKFMLVDSISKQTLATVALWQQSGERH